MKKSSILVIMCLLAGMLISSCGSSKPCPAYRSVSPTTSFVEIPSDTDSVI